MNKLEDFFKNHSSFLNDKNDKRTFTFFRSKKYMYFDKGWKEVELNLIDRFKRFVGWKYKETYRSSFKAEFLKQAKDIDPKKCDQFDAISRLAKKLFNENLQVKSDEESHTESSKRSRNSSRQTDIDTKSDDKTQTSSEKQTEESHTESSKRSRNSSRQTDIDTKSDDKTQTSSEKQTEDSLGSPTTDDQSFPQEDTESSESDSFTEDFSQTEENRLYFSGDDDFEESHLITLLNTHIHVEKVTLPSSMDLSKNIINALNNLKELKVLRFNSNNVSEKDFATLDLPLLEEIVVEGSYQNVNFLSHLKNFKNLKYLKLDCFLPDNTGNIRNLLQELKQITALSLNGYRLHIDWPLPVLPHLDCLEINGFLVEPEIQSKIFENYKNPSLKHLKLDSFEALSFDTLQELLKNNPNIKQLTVWDCPQFIGKTFDPKLEVVGVPSKIAQNSLPLVELFESKSIKEVINDILDSDEKENFVHADFTGFSKPLDIDEDMLLELFEKCSSIKFFALDDAQIITTRTISALSKNQNLKTLILYDSHLSSKDLNSLKNSGLRAIFLNNFKNLTDVEFLRNMLLFEVSLKSCDHLQNISAIHQQLKTAQDSKDGLTVSIIDCPKVPDKDIQQIVDSELNSNIFFRHDRILSEDVEAINQNGEINYYQDDFNQYLERLVKSSAAQNIKYLDLKSFYYHVDNSDQTHLIALLQACKNLEKLVLPDNLKLSEDVIDAINHAKNIKILIIEGDELKEEIFSKLNLPVLSELEIGGEYEDLSFLKHCKNFDNLRHLDLVNCRSNQKESLQSVFEGLNQLRSLKLPSLNRVNIDGPLPLLPKLEDLTMDGFLVDQELAEIILNNYENSSLKKLNIKRLQSLSFDSLQKILKRNPNIQTLAANDCPQLIGKTFDSKLEVVGVPSKIAQDSFPLAELFENKSIKEVIKDILDSDEKENFVHADFTGFPEPLDIDEETLLKLLQQCPNIQFFALEDTQKITIKSLEALSKLNKLSRLTLKKSPLRSDDLKLLKRAPLVKLELVEFTHLTHMNFAQSFSKLERLSLISCERLEDIKALSYLKELYELEVKKCPLLTKISLNSSDLPKLRFVTIQECNRILDRDIQRLADDLNLLSMFHDRVLREDIEKVIETGDVSALNKELKAIIEKLQIPDNALKIKRLDLRPRFSESISNDDFLRILQACKNLEELILPIYYDLDRDMLQAIDQMQKLKVLRLYGNGVSYENLSELKLSNLEEFSFAGQTSDRSILGLLKQLPKLRVLDLRNFMTIKGVEPNISDLLSGLNHLKTLILTESEFTFNKPLPYLPKLETLKFDDFSGTFLQEVDLFENYNNSSLKEVDISGLTTVTSKSVANLIENNPIKTLIARNCPQLKKQDFKKEGLEVIMD